MRGTNLFWDVLWLRITDFIPFDSYMIALLPINVYLFSWFRKNLNLVITQYVQTNLYFIYYALLGNELENTWAKTSQKYPRSVFVKFNLAIAEVSHNLTTDGIKEEGFMRNILYDFHFGISSFGFLKQTRTKIRQRIHIDLGQSKFKRQLNIGRSKETKSQRMDSQLLSNHQYLRNI
jgi:hypothetical protein